MDNNWIKDFKQNILYRLDENVRMVSIALAKVEDDETWVKQNMAVNTLGNQLLHISGNLTQYIVSGLGGKPDVRNRDVEFETKEGATKDELLKDLLDRTQDVTQVIQNASEEDLLTKHKVQGFEFSGIGLAIHAVEHFSYHTGQIATLVKLIVDEPLGFYAGIDLNTRNEGPEMEDSDLEAKNQVRDSDDAIPE